MVSAGDFKNGITVQMDNGIWQIIEFQHVKPGKGAAFVRTKMKNIVSGGVVEKNISIYILMEIFTTSWIQKHSSRLLLQRKM